LRLKIKITIEKKDRNERREAGQQPDRHTFFSNAESQGQEKRGK
jgi:hypothetical protein